MSKTPAVPRAFLFNMPPNETERCCALAMLAVLGFTFVLFVPFSHIYAGPLPGFIPGCEAALAVCNLITGILLTAQFARSGSASMLVLGSGYLFNALMVLSHGLSFHGMSPESGFLDGSDQTAIWLYVFWHAGFPVYVLAYTVLRGAEEARGAPLLLPVPALAATAGATAVLTGCFWLLAFLGPGLLPRILVNASHIHVLTSGVSPAVWIISLLAFFAQWRVKERSILDLWLTVVLGAWILEVVLAIIVGVRLNDWSFYLSRFYGLTAAAAVLFKQLLEMNGLYGDLTLALSLAETSSAELDRSREELSRAHRMEAVGRLTGGVAHDFNNLLTVITGNIELILASRDLPDRVRRLADGALQGAWRGARITDQLLTFARKHVSRPVSADLNHLLADFQPLIRQAVTAEVELRLELAPKPVLVRLDVTLFERAVLNLVVNARDAMPAGGRIVIRTGMEVVPAGLHPDLQPGRYAVVTVADTGFGMTRETVARAFEPFFTTKPIGEGSGLGLSQVYGFVTGSGGAVEIETALGKGTRIHMYLPMFDRVLPPA